MAMMIFTGLNGMGVVFLVYVLVQFWKEGHRSRGAAGRRHEIQFFDENKPDVFVVTQPISGGLQVADAPKPALWRRRVEPAPVPQSAQAGLSVVTMRARENSPHGKRVPRDSGDAADELSVKRFSTR